MDKKQEDFYRKLRARIDRWAARGKGPAEGLMQYVLLAPDMFHLMVKLSMDTDVPKAEKMKLAGAIGYFVFATDLVPEILLGAAGYVDDIALAAWVLSSVIESAGPEVLKRHWAGRGDVLDTVARVLRAGHDILSRRRVTGKHAG